MPEVVMNLRSLLVVEEVDVMTLLLATRVRDVKV